MTPEPAATDKAEAHPPPDPATYALAYQEAKRALEDQQGTVTEVRSRAGQLIAAAAITTSFLLAVRLRVPHRTLTSASTS